jgi:hypothetical protein
MELGTTIHIGAIGVLLDPEWFHLHRSYVIPLMQHVYRGKVYGEGFLLERRFFPKKLEGRT